jgi:hypothetical protein
MQPWSAPKPAFSVFHRDPPPVAAAAHRRSPARPPHLAQIPGAQRFPAGTVVSGNLLVPGQIAQCVGRFPFPNPAPFRLPANGLQYFSPPNGGRCAGQFARFYQGLGPDGGFVVQVRAAWPWWGGMRGGR